MYVVTFYSFKGGVGRTLALLNVAWELADSDPGKKVLVVDFDLEAPGIRADRWARAQADSDAEFRSDGDTSHEGIVEYVAKYLDDDLRVPDVKGYIVDVTPSKCQGRLALMPAGVDDETYGARWAESTGRSVPVARWIICSRTRGRSGQTSAMTTSCSTLARATPMWEASALATFQTRW